MKKRSAKCLVNISIKNLFFNIWSTFKQHNNVDQSISVSQIMYSKSLGLDCQPFFFAALLPFQIPTPGIFPYWFFFENFQSLQHRAHTQGKNAKSQSPVKSQSRKISKTPHTAAAHTGKKA